MKSFPIRMVYLYLLYVLTCQDVVVSGIKQPVVSLSVLYMKQTEECAIKRVFGVIIWYNNVVGK